MGQLCENTFCDKIKPVDETGGGTIMNKIKKIFIFLSGIIVIALLIGVVSPKANTSIAAEVEENFTKMSGLSLQQSLSSNPYDYINNEYYDNIVAMGFPAVQVIEEGYYSGHYGGLNAYIAGVAIQDITNMRLYECVGIDWETAEQFFDSWDATINELPEIFGEIMNSDDSMEEKLSRMEKFGIFGQYFLTTLANESGTSVELSGETVSVTGYETSDLQDFEKLSAKEMKEVEEYLQSR